MIKKRIGITTRKRVLLYENKHQILIGFERLTLRFVEDRRMILLCLLKLQRDREREDSEEHAGAA
jgi:hypothetical protein